MICCLPDYEDQRLQFAFRNTQDLIRIATGDDPLQIRALAAWYAIGTDRRPSPCLSSKQGDPTAIFNALQEASIPASVVEIAREGFRVASHCHVTCNIDEAEGARLPIGHGDVAVDIGNRCSAAYSPRTTQIACKALSGCRQQNCEHEKKASCRGVPPLKAISMFS
jgi:hypothetical protein